MDYQAFLDTKRGTIQATGPTILPSAVHAALFPFQRDLVRWSVRKGCAALFADTGLGKTFMQLEWARLLGQRTLIIAPLSVARQTTGEARKLGLSIKYVRAASDVEDGINITNYEMIGHFDFSQFGAVVLDESSILKGLTGATRERLTELCADIPYRLCCTATPAPNDITELANHAEFLGIMTRADMLASFFVHDDDGWRLKRHAREPFYRWLASWAMSIRKPSDLGYGDEGYALPPLTVTPVWVHAEYTPPGMLFGTGLKGIQDRIGARKCTTDARVAAAAQLVNADADQWILWCGLNEEGRQLHKAIPSSVLVEGSQTPEEKAGAIEAFQDGVHRVLITKIKIAGLGMNFQNAHKMAFVGLNDSFEGYYQGIRREWRFGQTEPVQVYVVLSEVEDEILANVQRKEKEAQRMANELIANVQQFEQAEIQAAGQSWEYQTDSYRGENFLAMLGDSAERLKEIASESVGLSVFSPPFMSLYTYTPTERDIGNSKGKREFFEHFGFVIDELLRVTIPGRNVCVHLAQVPAMLSRDGYIGLKDFRGATIEEYERRGFIYHGEVCIDKDPQAQAIRTKSKALLFVQKNKDSSWLRPALADYILVFRKPGANPAPIISDLTNDEWIHWARPIWYGISENDTLQYSTARANEDERHICPLQLGTIERCVRLWSNRGDRVLSPFMGIGSEGHVALKLGRLFIGIELKESYYRVAVRNLQETATVRRPTLFDLAEVGA